MGTPGDKSKLGEVVQPAQLDPKDDPPPDPNVEADPGSSSPSSMTVLTQLPQFGTFDYKGEGSLEQAHIEDYFSQSKFYPSSDVSPVPAPPAKTFLNLDEPGPSGLQPKSKSIPSPKLHPKRTKKPMQSPKKSYVCQTCQKSFPNAAKLTKHQLIHGGSSPFKCEHCKKSFSSKFKLVRHVLIHSDRKPFSCSVCERTFHRKDHLKNHVKVHSPSKKLYVCEKPHCKKEYTSLLSFKKHSALHAAEEGSLQCQICSKTFETKDEILYHLKIHAGSRTVKNPNEKKFTCDHCGRKFFTRKDVRRHLVVHTGMRDFLCQFCPQTFGRKDHLVRHIKKSHSKFPFESQTEIKSEIPEFVDIPELVIKSETPEPTVPELKFAGSPLELPNIEMGSLFFQQSFSELNPVLQQQTSELQYLPCASAKIEDLTSEILEDIGEAAAQDISSELMTESVTNPSDINTQLLDETVLMNDPEIMRLLQTSEDKNLPLPGFSQTFQSPPPPPPP